MATAHAAGPRVLGLTGPIACGKTTAGNILLDLGAIERLDADRVVHELLQADSPTTWQVAQEFGPEVIRPDGAVDRKGLAQIVFADHTALRRLEAIVHPAVRQAIRARIAELSGRRGVVVVDAVRLLQSDLLPLCDAVWVVRCDATAQLHRLLRNRGMSESEAQGRLSAQPPFEHQRVTTVIENTGSRQDLRRQVEEAYQALLQGWHLAPPPCQTH